MTRKEMIIAIANDAGCSRRLVRKKLFARCVELKKTRPNLLFYKPFLDKNTEWVRLGPNGGRPKVSFEVCCRHKGIIVLFFGVAEKVHVGTKYEDTCYTDCCAELRHQNGNKSERLIKAKRKNAKHYSFTLGDVTGTVEGLFDGFEFPGFEPATMEEVDKAVNNMWKAIDAKMKADKKK